MATIASVIASVASGTQDAPEPKRHKFCTEVIRGAFAYHYLRSYPGRDFAVVQTEGLGPKNSDVLKIGKDFRAVPFGIPPLPYHEIDPHGRVIAVDDRSVYALSPGDEALRRVIHLDEEPYFSFQLRRDPTSGAVLVNRNGRTYPDNWMVVRGDRLEPWSDWIALRAVRAASLGQIIEEPETGTLLALGQEADEVNDDVYARKPDGAWSKVHELRKTWRSFYIGVPQLRAQFVPRTGRIAVVTRAEAFTIDPTVDPPNAEFLSVGKEHPGFGHLMVSVATDSLLLLDKKQEIEDGSETELYHLTAGGLAPVPGDPVRIEDPRIWNYLTDLPSIGRVAVAAEGRLWLYDGETVREIEDYASVGWGETIHWRDRPAIGKVLGRSVTGLYTLSEAGEIKPIAVPYSLEWGPSPDGPQRKEELVDWPSECDGRDHARAHLRDRPRSGRGADRCPAVGPLGPRLRVFRRRRRRTCAVRATAGWDPRKPRARTSDGRHSAMRLTTSAAPCSFGSRRPAFLANEELPLQLTRDALRPLLQAIA